MSTNITLTIVEGSLKGEKFEFRERTTCILGRAKDCNPRLPRDESHRSISRYHCLLDINPPQIRIRDFGSKNGTSVNGKKIGQRDPDQTRQEAAKIIFPEYDLKHGDEIKLGETVFRVSIELKIKDPQTRDIEQAKLITLKQNKHNTIEVVRQLLNRANGGERKLRAIQGYTIVKLLGKGALGEVYLARHNPTGQEVALKVVLPDVAPEMDILANLQREIQNIQALRHPHIVKLQDYSYLDEMFLFILEYCDGGNINDLMRKRGEKLFIDEAAPIIMQLLDGLEYAHNAESLNVKLADGIDNRGLVHRDIKPSNIFLASDGDDDNAIAKIGDYGLAKAFDLAGLSGQTMTGIKASTLAFMPRQQVIDFKYAKPEVDVWAIAATLYYMLTGLFPRDFGTKDPFLAVLQNEPVPILERDRSIPKNLAKIIDLALIDHPQIHFKTATEFKQAIASVI